MSFSEIHNHGLEGNFTLVPNSIINHEVLNIKERFYLIWALSLPPRWQLNTKSIATMLDISPRTITSYNKSLKEAGFLIIDKLSTGVTVWHFFATVEIRQKWQEKQATDTKESPQRKNCVQGSKSLIAKKPDQPFLLPINKTDLINKTLKEKTSSFDNEQECSKVDQLEKEFTRLWSVWPNAKNKIRSHSAFKTFFKGKSLNGMATLVTTLVNDVGKRLTANQLGFSNMMLSTYLNGQRFNDDITGPETIKKNTSDEQKAINDRANRKMAESRERFGM